MTPNFSIRHSEYQVHEIPAIVAMAIYHQDCSDWVNQAICSIREQSYRNFLFIIVIDGPVSPSLQATVMQHASEDNRLIVIEGAVNRGLAACMNFAIDWSLSLKPNYFFRMDADDVSVTNRLEKQINYLEKHAHVAVLGTGLEEINEQNVKVGARVMPLTNRQITRLLPRRCTINHPTVCIRYKVFTDGYRYDDSLRNTQDYFLWIELAAQGYIFCNLKDKLLMFRRVNDFYKRRGLTKSLNEFRARLRAMRVLKRFTPYNLLYACLVLGLRMMPSTLVKMAYKLDRHLLEKFIKH